jgi:hypothetical protein
MYYPQISSACFGIKTTTSFIKADTLKLDYFTHFDSNRSYRVFFWENSTDSERVSNIQKKT